MVQSFKKLKVYERAFSLCKNIFSHFEGKRTSFRAKEQLLASVSSVCANLAEMAAFESKTQQMQKISVCIGEANECEFWLDLMKALGVLEEKKHAEFIENLGEVRAMLYGLRKSVGQDIKEGCPKNMTAAVNSEDSRLKTGD